MPDIWRRKDDGTKDGKWSIVGTSSFENECALQQRIAASPEMLPLSGQPFLAAAFREVGLGGGHADVLAFEDNGRPCVIEVKLKKNSEAKRAVVAQALTYAAGLRGIGVEKLEKETLKEKLKGKRLVDFVRESESVDEDNFDEGVFYDNLRKHLGAGSFRIVIVLDDAPLQLVRLIGYLDLFTTKDISLDLVTMSAYDIKDEQFLIPQRIDPDHALEPEPATETTVHRQSRGTTTTTKSSADFRKFVAQSENPDHQKNRQDIADWADRLEEEGLCRVHSAEGVKRLRLYLLDENKTFAHFESHGQGVWLYPTVIQRRAPAMLDRIRELTDVQGNKGGAPATPELLDALADAYREAASTA